MAHNLARWTARIGLGEQVVTTKTLRRRFFSLAGRLTRSARRLTLHLPRRWPWKTSSVAPWHDCAPCHFQPDGARLPLTRHPANGTSPPTRAKSASEPLLLHAALTISPSAATAGPNIPLAWLPHPALSHIYWIKPSPSLSIASHPLSPLHGYIPSVDSGLTGHRTLTWQDLRRKLLG